MHREILFRGKRIDNGEWVYGFYVREEGLKGDGFHSISHTIITKREPFRLYQDRVYVDTVGQYTGLKDRNGVKIFEGDYIYHHWHKDTAYLVWHERYICFVGKPFEGDTSKTYHYQKPDEPDLEVIGNIHDNPELLEV